MRSFGGTSSTYWFCTMLSTSVNSRSCSYVALWSALLLATDPPSDRVSTTRSVLITKAFFMDVLSYRRKLATLAEPLFGILRLALIAHLEIEPWPGERPRIAHRPDPLSLTHVLAFLRLDLGDVGVERVVLVAVVHDNQVTVSFEPPRIDHMAAVHREHFAAHRRLDVDSIPESPGAEPRMHLRAEPRDDPPFRRPRQTPFQRAEPDRGTLDPALRWRNPRQLALFGLELPDERFEAVGRFRQFAHHALVVRALVAHLGENHTPLRSLAVDLRLFPLGVFVEAGQLLLLRLLLAFAVRQSLRGNTILLNQAGVQGREAREMSHGHGTGDRILAAEDHR